MHRQFLKHIVGLLARLPLFLFLSKLSVLFLLLASVSVHANPVVKMITDQLQRPWSLAFLPDGRFLVTEKTGQLRIVDSQGTMSAPISGLPAISVVGQGGLLDVAVHPDFVNNQWIYLSYVAGSAVRGYNTEVVRARLVNQALVDTQLIFSALPKTKGGRHFGSRLLLVPTQNDGNGQTHYLYISLGDRGLRSPSQDLGSHTGSLIRVYDDGEIPEDNPFLGRPDARPEIFSYGHRNIQGLALHPQTGEVWLHEHGPQGGDELNLIAAGKNYGWPVITYGVNYGIGTKIGEGTHKPGMEQPQYQWTPSIAPSGLAYYRGSWLVGALKYQLLATLTPTDNTFSEKRFLERQYGRIRDVRVKDNTIYLLTDANKGRLLELTFSEPPQQ